jgi:hypothetical protein
VEEPIENVTYQHISMYKEPPTGEVCIEDFERFAIDRLRGAYFSVHQACRHLSNARNSPYIARCCKGSGTYKSLGAHMHCPIACESVLCAAVLKGIEDAKTKGFKGEQLQVCHHAGL